MDRAEDGDFDEILDTEAAADWQARLTAAFFDAEARRRVIDEVRAAIADRLPAGDAAGLEPLRRRVVRHLVGVASRDATPPAREPGARPSPISGAELEDRVVNRYPYPIATPYRALTEQEPGAGAFGCLLDTFEGLVHFLATVAVTAYLRGGLASPDCNSHLLRRLVKDVWATGDLMALLRDTVRMAGDCEGRLPYRELPGYLFDGRGRPTGSLQVLESFVSLRNRDWAHGGGRDEDFFAGILPPNRARLEAELAEVPWLASWELVRPLAIDDSGRVWKADLLMGDRRLKARPYDLQLEPGDLDHRGGDVRPETSLLLVSPARDNYLPLFPLSLFHFQLRSQGVYFLQRPQWQTTSGRRQIRRAGYVAYESGLEAYESGPGEPASRSIERHVGRLESNLLPVLEESPTTTTEPADDPACELPEVHLEQEFHLRTFAGREAFLGRIADWIDGEAEGGYLLLLGPPGQGKSALMAELARRRGERGGCLLHMVKSHRNPLKFLPSMIGQAARLAGVRFGPGAYRGDVDDLRNALIRALGAVTARSGRAILFIDALDELGAAEDRVGFLPEVLPAGVRFVLTCRPDIPLVLALRSRLRSLEEWPLPPLSEDDLPALLRRRLGPEVDRGADSPDWRELFRRLRGNPLLIHRALDQIAREVALARREGRPARIDTGQYPSTLEELFRAIYDEAAERRPGVSQVSEGRQKELLLRLLCSAREPLGFEALGGLMAELGEPLSLEDCRDRVLAISQYLLDAGGSRFKPWHEGLSSYVLSHALDQTRRLELEAGFAAWSGASAPDWGGYALRHHLSHLLSARDVGAAASRLSEPAFLEAKAEAGLIFELLEDFEAVLGSLPPGDPSARLLGLLGEAIRADVHFIGRHPTALFQCLWNRGWWFDRPVATAHYAPTGSGATGEGPPSRRTDRVLSDFLEGWRRAKEVRSAGTFWARSLRPPGDSLGTSRGSLFQGHRGAVTGVAFLASGRLIVSGSEDGTVRVWDARNGAEVARLEDRARGITGVAASPDGRLVAAGSTNGRILIWESEGWASLADFPGHEGGVTSLAFSRDGRMLVSGSLDTTARAWDPSTGAGLAAFRGHSGAVLCVALSPDGTTIATGSRDATVRLWDSRTGAERSCLRGHESPVRAVVFSPDGGSIYTLGYMSIRLWDLTAASVSSRMLASGYGVRGIALDPDGRRLAVAGFRSIRVLDAPGGRELAHIRGHESWVECVAFSDDGRRIVSGSAERTVGSWESGDVKGPSRLPDHALWVHGVTFSPDGSRVFTRSDDGEIRIWDAATGFECGRIPTQIGRIRGLSVSHGERRVSFGLNSGIIRVLYPGGKYEDTYAIGDDEEGIGAVTVSPDFKYLAAGTMSGSVYLFAFAGDSVLARYRSGDRGAIVGLRFSPDGRRLASASSDGTIRIWPLELGPVRSIRSIALRVLSSVSIFPAGGCLTLPQDQKPRESVLEIAFSTNGEFLSSRSNDGEIDIWDLGKREKLIRWAPRWSPKKMGQGTNASRGEAGGAAGRDLQEVALAVPGPGGSVVRFPKNLHHLAVHPSGRSWAGAWMNQVFLITLERFGEGQGRPRGVEEGHESGWGA